jgi:hypothetical protein
LKDDINVAWSLWSYRIGEAGETNGHSLVFREYKFKEGSHPYCWFKDTENGNPDVPNDIAAFGLDTTPGVQAWSITGYIPKEFNDDPDRHGGRFNRVQTQVP